MRITMEFDAMDVLDLRSGAAALTAMADTICAPQHAPHTVAEQVADTQAMLPFLPRLSPAAAAAFGDALYSAPVPAPPPAPVLPAVEVDGAGTPYDPKVHSSSKALKADGTWRKRRVNGPGDEDDAVVAPPPPAPVAVVAPPPVPTTAEPMSLGAMLTKITPLMAAGVLTQQQVMDEIAAMGIANGFGGLTSGDGAARIPELMTRLKVPA